MRRYAIDASIGVQITNDASAAILIDILSEIIIDRPRAEVAAYAADPARAPDWYLNICDIEWQTEPRLQVGTRFAFMTRMVGRMHSHTYEVVEYVPGERLMMLNGEGAFPVETTYTWEEHDECSTRMTMRYRGEPTGLLKLLASFMGAATRRAIEKDLERLKRLIEKLAPASNEPAS